MASPRPRSARAPRPPAPPLPLYDQLDETHRLILRALEQMGQLIERLDAEGLDVGARQLAGEIYAVFDKTARAHHAAEEQHVFPPLLADAALAHQVQRLQQDHGWLEEDWIEIEPQLLALSEGHGGFDIDMLRAAVPVFTQLYHEHIALEETVIYPAGKRLQRGHA